MLLTRLASDPPPGPLHLDPIAVTACVGSLLIGFPSHGC